MCFLGSAGVLAAAYGILQKKKHKFDHIPVDFLIICVDHFGDRFGSVRSSSGPRLLFSDADDWYILSLRRVAQKASVICGPVRPLQ